MCGGCLVTDCIGYWVYDETLLPAGGGGGGSSSSGGGGGSPMYDPYADSYLGDGLMDDDDNDNTADVGPTQTMPNSFLLNNGTTVIVTFGITQSDNQNAQQTVSTPYGKCLDFCLRNSIKVYFNYINSFSGND